MPTREKGAARNGGQPDPEVSSLPLFEPPTPTDLSACATYQSLVDMKQSKRGAVASTGTRGNDLIAPRQRHLSTPLLTPLATPTPQPIRKGLRPRCSGLEPIAVARKGGPTQMRRVGWERKRLDWPLGRLLALKNHTQHTFAAQIWLPFGHDYICTPVLRGTST